MKTRRLLLSCMFLSWCAALFAGDSLYAVTMKDLFRQMPDTLLPSLSRNNRLDLIDFVMSGMKAEVENRLGGTSIMTALADDSLSLSLSECERVDMLLLTLDEPVEAGSQVILLAETFLVDTLYGETVLHFYTTEWQPITHLPPLNPIQQHRIEGLELQNILKWSERVLKNS